MKNVFDSSVSVEGRRAALSERAIKPASETATMITEHPNSGSSNAPPLLLVYAPPTPHHLSSERERQDALPGRLRVARTPHERRACALRVVRSAAMRPSGATLGRLRRAARFEVVEELPTLLAPPAESSGGPTTTFLPLEAGGALACRLRAAARAARLRRPCFCERSRAKKKSSAMARIKLLSRTAIAQSPACCRSRTRTKSPRPGRGERRKRKGSTIEPPMWAFSASSGRSQIPSRQDESTSTRKTTPSRHSQGQSRSTGSTPTPTTSALPRPPSRKATARAGYD